MSKVATLNQSLVETYCELGVVDLENGKRFTHQAIKGDDAYDHFVLALYFKQILQANKLLSQKHVRLEDIPRKEKVLFLYELFNQFNWDLTYFEIGTTLFEFIDGVELMDKIFTGNDKVRTTVRYRGVEISELLKDAAVRLHPNHDIKHLGQISDIQDMDIFYDRVVSSYCFKNSKELAEVMNRAKVSYVNLYLSKTISFDVINDVGKTQTFFSLPSLVRHLDRPLYYLFGRLNDNNIQGFFLNCEEKELKAIMARFQSNRYLDEFMKSKNVRVVNAKEFIKPDRKQAEGLIQQHIREPYEKRLKDYESAISA